ncbi:hypothetical protein NCLIV_012540 [Neospora caninum Liverpool]|uniref:Cyclin-dependent kinases regulatory subunit n=1 Tax=Neospora caninum (strain Liverpool) TaxID=572307 RepID=F0VCU1_NEOCL|nr:hypothetical protein NCLIV_012540 [Neospora caninum Liverpool]CBZ51456.1 hypothetical protein NCLIV_012540 [Neospora caninum Liverpool]CEL65405.1 TPA: Cyclin-dependent kinases regulatory subunit [Neospora caninum Liverpool]|eukprot:XP_003881489.1 hypothetical protein NCLIV_012540 [Neospora caninum Liverpool]
MELSEDPGRASSSSAELSPMSLGRPGVPQASLACLLTTVPRYAAASLKESSSLWGKNPGEKPSALPRSASGSGSVDRGVSSGVKLRTETTACLLSGGCSGSAAFSEWGETRCMYTAKARSASTEGSARRGDTRSTFCGLLDERASSREGEDARKYTTHSTQHSVPPHSAHHRAVGEEKANCLATVSRSFSGVAHRRSAGVGPLEAAHDASVPAETRLLPAERSNGACVAFQAETCRFPLRDGERGALPRGSQPDVGSASAPSACVSGKETLASSSGSEGKAGTARQPLSVAPHGEKSGESRRGLASNLESAGGARAEQIVNREMVPRPRGEAEANAGAVSTCGDWKEPEATSTGAPETQAAEIEAKKVDAGPGDPEQEWDSEEEQERERRLAANYKPLFVPVDEELGKKINCPFVRGDLRMYPKKVTQFGEVHYSPRYEDDRYVYRHVLLSSGVRKAAEEMAQLHSKTGFLSEEQFIYQLGIDLSPGWQHFMRFKGRMRELILRRPPTAEDEKRDGAPGADDEISVDSDDSDFDASREEGKAFSSSARTAHLAAPSSDCPGAERVDRQEPQSGLPACEETTAEPSRDPALPGSLCCAGRQRPAGGPFEETGRTDKAVRRRAETGVWDAADPCADALEAASRAPQREVENPDLGGEQNGATAGAVQLSAKPAQSRSQGRREQTRLGSAAAERTVADRKKGEASGAASGFPMRQRRGEVGQVSRERSCVRRAPARRREASQDVSLACASQIDAVSKRLSRIPAQSRVSTRGGRRSSAGSQKRVDATHEGETGPGSSWRARRRACCEKKTRRSSEPAKQPKRRRRCRVAGAGPSSP